MKSFFYRMFARLTGRNSANTPVNVISSQLHEPRPLPLGAAEYEEWSERIIAGAMITADHDSQKFALANMIMQLGPTIHMKEDIHFISQLRKVAVNQVADSVRREIQAKVKERTAEEEAKAKADKEAQEAVEASVKTTKERIATVTADYEKRIEGVKITTPTH
jgi:hypothetical protein